MTGSEQEDLMLAQCGRLEALEPDAGRAERHRVRCCRALTERRLTALRIKRATAVTARVVEALFVGAFSVAYLSAVIHIVRLLQKH
jgi:hypothetical protein